MLKVSVNGDVSALYVDEAKTVQQLMDEICSQLRIKNNQNFSLAREKEKEPSQAKSSIRSKGKDKKEARRSVQPGEISGVLWLWLNIITNLNVSNRKLAGRETNFERTGCSGV